MRLILLLFTVLFLGGCKVNQFTGKKTLNFFKNNDYIFGMSFKEYNSFLESNTVISNTPESEKIEQIGKEIAKAAQEYFEYKGLSEYLKDYQWEYHLVEDKTVNAWCMPGGKIVFYTGILGVASNDDGIATIMGHEVAHALADHGAQRMSAGMLQQFGGLATQQLSQNESEEKKDQIIKAYNLASAVGGILPYSRKHETEADKIGLQLMTIAGYNPNEAPKLWQRMKAQSKGSTPEFLSTHPAEETRITNLKNWIKEAQDLALIVRESRK